MTEMVPVCETLCLKKLNTVDSVRNNCHVHRTIKDTTTSEGKGEGELRFQDDVSIHTFTAADGKTTDERKGKG
jgi:hypothetical protein